MSGLADADNFESNPMCAAYMVISYIYAKGLEINDYDDEYDSESEADSEESEEVTEETSEATTEETEE